MCPEFGRSQVEVDFVINKTPATSTVTATNTASPTASPTPSCSNVSVTATWVNSGSVYVNVRNNNSGTVYLTDSNLVWTAFNGGSQRVDYFEFGGNRYYDPSGNNSSPTSAAPGTPISLLGGQTKTWEVQFSNYGSQLFGTFDVTLEFDNGCDVNVVVVESTPTPTATFCPVPACTATPTNTFTPTRTPTPTNTWTPTATSTPDCSLISIGTPYIPSWNRDDIRVDITNNNPFAIALTNSSLSWVDYWHPEGEVNRFSLGGTTYWNGDDGDPPTNNIVPSSTVTIGSGNTSTWAADYNNVPELYGAFTITLQFGSCTVSASTDVPTPTATSTPTNTRTPTVTPTPTNTGTPTRTPTRTTTPLPTRTGTATNTPTVTRTPTSTPISSPTPTETPNCPLAGSAFRVIGNKVTWNLENRSLAGTFQISQITVQWPTSVPDPGLTDINLDTTPIWSGGPITGGSTTISGGWSGSAGDRSILPGETLGIELIFDQNLVTGGGNNVFVVISFTNGCSVIGNGS